MWSPAESLQGVPLFRIPNFPTSRLPRFRNSAFWNSAFPPNEHRLLVTALPLLVLILQLVQLPINASRREKLLVRSHLAHMALVHHQNTVRALDGRKPVRDHDRRAPLHQVIERLANPLLRLRVDARRG